MEDETLLRALIEFNLAFKKVSETQQMLVKKLNEIDFNYLISEAKKKLNLCEEEKCTNPAMHYDKGRFICEEHKI